MRRFALIVLAAGFAALGAGWLALGASGDPASAPARPSATPAAAKADLPPLPAKLRPRAVDPIAGETTSDLPAEDPGLSDPGPAPTRAATSGTVRRAAEATRAADPAKAVALDNGVALPPLDGPEAVKKMIEAGNAIARTPYLWGGGHGKWLDKGYDCSGSVSFTLAAAGLLDGPLDSGRLSRWGEPGPGRWVTIYANAGHVFMEVAGIRFDTSGQKVTGSRWQTELRGHAGFVARHPAGL